jgi:hypothetical protein
MFSDFLSFAGFLSVVSCAAVEPANKMAKTASGKNCLFMVISF